VQYPPREVCRSCLGNRLVWREVDGGGEVLSSVELHNSLETWFQERLPWAIASVMLDCGVVALVHVAPGARESGTRVVVRNVADSSGESALYAIPVKDRDLDHGDLDSLLKEYGLQS
jgi:uncharacterized OB-fold protein